MSDSRAGENGKAGPPAAQGPGAAPRSSPGTSARPAPAERLLSLDAYRGAIMHLMASSGLGLAEVARHFPGSAWWRLLGTQTDHAAWAGCTLWDIIQPAFMFMVGIALPWSLANRRARGQTFQKLISLDPERQQMTQDPFFFPPQKFYRVIVR